MRTFFMIWKIGPEKAGAGVFLGGKYWEGKRGGSMEPIIEFKNFSFKYRSQKEPTIKDINLSIYPGEKVLIVGPSGSGKSTLAHCINGLVPFSYKGEIT